MRIGIFGGNTIGVTDFAAVEFPGTPDEAAETRAAVSRLL